MDLSAAKVMVVVPCDQCGKTGKVTNGTCPTCFGTGELHARVTMEEFAKAIDKTLPMFRFPRI